MAQSHSGIESIEVNIKNIDGALRIVQIVYSNYRSSDQDQGYQ